MSTGLLHSAQNLLAGLVAIGRTRLELFSAELQEEIARQAAALIGAFLALVLAALALAFGALAVLVAVDEQHRLAASISVAVLFAALAVAAVLALRGLTRSKPRAFQASIAQLERDYDALKP